MYLLYNFEFRKDGLLFIRIKIYIQPGFVLLLISYFVARYTIEYVDNTTKHTVCKYLNRGLE